MLAFLLTITRRILVPCVSRTAWQAVVVVNKLHRSNHPSGGDEKPQDFVIGTQLHQKGRDAI